MSDIGESIVQLGHTMLNQETLKFVWTIDNYKVVSEELGVDGFLLSKGKCFHSSRYNWDLQLYMTWPRNTIYLKPFLDFFHRNPHLKVDMQYHFHILDPADPTDCRILFTTYTQATKASSRLADDNDDLLELISKRDLYNQANGYLGDGGNGCLKLMLEFTILEKSSLPLSIMDGITTEDSSTHQYLSYSSSSGDLCDFEISDGNGHSFHCHKQLLAHKSPVFRAMLMSGRKESTENRQEITDVEPKVLEQLLHFIYYGNIQWEKLDVELGAGLLIAADKYRILDLVTLCEKQLEEVILPKGPAETLEPLATFLQITPSSLAFRGNIIDIIIRSPSIMNSEEFVQFAKKYPEFGVEILLKSRGPGSSPQQPKRARLI